MEAEKTREELELLNASRGEQVVNEDVDTYVRVKLAQAITNHHHHFTLACSIQHTISPHRNHAALAGGFLIRADEMQVMHASSATSAISMRDAGIRE